MPPEAFSWKERTRTVYLFACNNAETNCQVGRNWIVWNKLHDDDDDDDDDWAENKRADKSYRLRQSMWSERDRSRKHHITLRRQMQASTASVSEK